MADKYLKVMHVQTGKEEERIKVSNPTRRKVEKIMKGMLRQMSEEYYIDDSDFDDLE